MSTQKTTNLQSLSVQIELRVFVDGHRHLTVVTEIYSVLALCALSVTYDCSCKSNRRCENTTESLLLFVGFLELLLPL
jgi:hypothetical protein